jgi:hypothetical protein
MWRRLLFCAGPGTEPSVPEKPALELGPAPVQLAGACEPLHTYHRVRAVDDELVSLAIPISSDLATDERVASPEEVEHVLPNVGPTRSNL